MPTLEDAVVDTVSGRFERVAAALARFNLTGLLKHAGWWIRDASRGLLIANADPERRA